MLNWNEPVTHLFLDEDADGRHYQVTVPVRIAGGAIGGRP